MAEFEVGRSLKSENVEQWASLAAPGLADGEVILAMHAGVRIRPMTELAIVTPARVILVETRAGAFAFKREYRLADVVEVRANPRGSNGQILLVMTDGDKEKFGTAGIRNAKADAIACAAAIENARQHPDGPATSRALPPAAETRYEPSMQPTRVSNKYDAKAAEHDARAAELKERRDALSDPALVLGDAQIVGGEPSAKALRVIGEHSMPDERPWLVINAGMGGVLAAYDDRLMVIKTGGMTSFMAGSMGGGRTATFHYSDVTGIEYNSGMATGVLEILTPSYSGGAQKDYWRGSNKSRNANSNDPYTLSNTLPLARALHTQALPHLNELRSRIAASKRTVIAQTQGGPAVAAPTSGLAAEIAELSALRDAGALSEDEFAAAKAKLLGR